MMWRKVSCSPSLSWGSARRRRHYRGRNLRDCLVVGFSMMGEAEFAFVVAVSGATARKGAERRSRRAGTGGLTGRLACGDV